jgi:TOTE conflict system primase-like protein
VREFLSDQSTPSIAERFHKLFDPLPRAYGTYTVSHTTAKGKRTGSAMFKREPVTIQLWQDHLDGKQSLGVVPVRDDATCLFGVLDIDTYDLSHVNLIAKLDECKLPVVVCRSKSGGAHCYLFASEPVPAYLMRERLREMIDFLGLPPTSEVFPKQDQLASDQDCGSFINAPLFDGLRGMRYAIRPDGTPMEAAEFLDYAEHRRSPASYFEEPWNLPDPEDAAPWNGPSLPPILSNGSGVEGYCTDGPPCLASIAASGYSEGGRNIVLTNFAKYAKRRYGKEWKSETGRFNERVFTPPLEHGEVEQICSSIGRRNYLYSCKEPALSAVCNATLCRTRKFGIMPADGPDGAAKYGDLSILETDPPIYFLSVNNSRVELTTEQFQSPKLFQRRVIEVARFAPPIVKQEQWTNIMNDLLSRAIPITAPADGSTDGQLLELLERFCSGRIRGYVPEELLIGKPWLHDGQVTIRLQDFERFLTSNQFKAYQRPKIISVLQGKAGGIHGETKVRGRSVATWTFPEFGEAIEGLPLRETGDEKKGF